MDDMAVGITTFICTKNTMVYNEFQRASKSNDRHIDEVHVNVCSENSEATRCDLPLHACTYSPHSKVKLNHMLRSYVALVLTQANGTSKFISALCIAPARGSGIFSRSAAVSSPSPVKYVAKKARIPSLFDS